MAKEFKTILIRDLDEETKLILNQVGENQKLKNGTDIIVHIVKDYQKKIDNFKRMEELFYEQRGKLSDANYDMGNLKRKLSDIQHIINRAQ